MEGKNMFIEEKLNTLVKLMLTSGVQPNELANNIFLEEYKSISYYKQNNMTIGELIFSDLESDAPSDVLLRYYYDSSKKVVLIEEEVFGVSKVLWDRETKEIELINEIVYLLKRRDYNNINKFLSSLPQHLYVKVTNQFKKAI